MTLKIPTKAVLSDRWPMSATTLKYQENRITYQCVHEPHIGRVAPSITTGRIPFSAD